jgi:caffeoyl-CoA O-methyltransferase
VADSGSMFDPLPPGMAARMAELEARDARERDDGSPQSRRLRQIPPETGRFLAILLASAPAGQVIEIGTSGGYSGMWLALACRETGRHLLTYDVDPAKVALARETFTRAWVDDIVTVVEADLRERPEDLEGVAFCFLDAEKDLYEEFYDLVVPRLVPGGLMVCDNVISHADALTPLVERSAADPRVDSVVVPIGKGELLVRRRA